MSNTITYNLEITNNKIVTPDFYTNTITPVGKIEREYNDLVYSDGYYDIATTKIGTLQTVFANSNDANLTFYTTSGVLSSFRIGGQFMWEVPVAVAPNIINCRVSTSSLSAVDVKINLIGV